MVRKSIFAIVLLSLSASASFAGDDLASAFDTLQHDFGRVQRGEMQNHQFVLKNTTQNDLRISGVSVSCGCTSASAASNYIKPGESTTINAAMDTMRFYGSKSVTVYVNFDSPYYTTVSLRVSAISEENLDFGATEVDLGVLTQGEKAERKFHLEYAGNRDWKITGLSHTSSHLRAEIKELSRDQNKVRYEMTVSLPDNLPAGPFKDRIKIQSTDPRTPEVMMLAKAMVEEKLTVSPHQIEMSNLVPGQKVSKTLIIKSPRPFAVVRAEGGTTSFEIRASAEKKTTQLVTVTFTVPDDISKMSDHLNLVTDLQGEKPVKVPIAR